jgi:hypothetical protein
MGRSFTAVTLIQNPSGHRTWRTSFGRQTQIVIERYPHFYLQSVFPVETINNLQRHSCEVLYPNIFLSALMGSNSYQYVANTPWLFGVAEHLFAVDVFGAHVLDSDAYLAEIARETELPFQSRRCTTQVVRPNYRDALSVYTEEVLRRESLAARPLAFAAFTRHLRQSLGMDSRWTRRVVGCRVLTYDSQRAGSELAPR